MLNAKEILDASILIVDDQRANIDLLTDVLDEAGYTKVSSTTNPLEVRQLHKKYGYDLILLDLRMPMMDGFEVMEELKADQLDDYLSVLVLTAEPNHKQRALDAGAKDFVSKPFDLIEVKTRIRNMLEVRLLYKKLKNYSKDLEVTVLVRTAELRESEARYRSLAELVSDWYWEQDENGNFTTVSGPVLDMLGFQGDSLTEGVAREGTSGWNEAERQSIRASIAARQPFLDSVFSRTNSNGTLQKFQVSGKPMFNQACRFVGYRGIGVEIDAEH